MLFRSVPIEDIRRYESELFAFLDKDPDGVAFAKAVKESGKLEESTEEHLKKALDVFTKQFLETKQS